MVLPFILAVLQSIFLLLSFYFDYLIFEQFQCVQLIFIQGEICARGYWNVTNDSSKEILLGQFRKKIENAGLNDLKDTLYFPQDAGNDESHNIILIYNMEVAYGFVQCCQIGGTIILYLRKYLNKSLLFCDTFVVRTVVK